MSRGKNQGDKLKYQTISSTFIPGQHLFSASESCCYMSPDVGLTGTHDVSLPTQFRLNVGPASQPIAGSNRLRRWSNTTPTLGLLYA